MQLNSAHSAPCRSFRYNLWGGNSPAAFLGSLLDARFSYPVFYRSDSVKFVCNEHDWLNVFGALHLSKARVTCILPVTVPIDRLLRYLQKADAAENQAIGWRVLVCVYVFVASMIHRNAAAS
jgi:hypothetical protein